MANDDLRDKLVTYIQDAYALENQIVEVLENHEKQAQNYPDIQRMIHQHLEETRQHQQRMETCLASYNEKPSAVKGASTNLMGNLLGLVSGGRTDTIAKNTRDEYVTEHMEIAAYGLLMATAQAYGDQSTIQACLLNLRDEVRMASLLEQQFPRVAILALQEDNISLPQTAVQQAQTTWQQTLGQIQQEVSGPMNSPTFLPSEMGSSPDAPLT